MINNIFNVIGKKNNQTSVSDADQEIPTLGSTDNAGNPVNLVSGIIRLHSRWDSSVCIGDRLDSICPEELYNKNNSYPSLQVQSAC